MVLETKVNASCRLGKHYKLSPNPRPKMTEFKLLYAVSYMETSWGFPSHLVPNLCLAPVSLPHSYLYLCLTPACIFASPLPVSLPTPDISVSLLPHPCHNLCLSPMCIAASPLPVSLSQPCVYLCLTPASLPPPCTYLTPALISVSTLHLCPTPAYISASPLHL